MPFIRKQKQGFIATDATESTEEKTTCCIKRATVGFALDADMKRR